MEVNDMIRNILSNIIDTILTVLSVIWTKVWNAMDHKWYKLAAYTVFLAIDIWIFASIFDVMLHNLDEHPHYQSWNLIDIWCKWREATH